MSRPTFNTQSVYTGTGAVASYSFNFKITRAEQLLVVILSSAGVELKRFRGTDIAEFQGLSFDRFKGGGTLVLSAPLAAGRKLGLFLDDYMPIQNYDFQNKNSFTLQRIEDALDNLGAGIQTLMRRMAQTLHFGEFDDPSATEFPSLTGGEGRLLVVDDEGKMALGPLLEDLGGGGIKPDGDPIAYDIITFDETLQPVFENAEFKGFSARYGQSLDLKGLREALRYIFNFQYVPPSVGLAASGNNVLREKGTVVNAVTLTAVVTKNSDPIASIKFYYNGTLVNTQAPPANLGSGNTSYNWTGSFSDDVNFSTVVRDNGATGGPTDVSANAGFSFVYPYYYGAANPGRTAAQVAALTKDIRGNSGNVGVGFTTVNGNVYYFAYPAAYGALNSIKDVNNFESINGWTRRSESITGLNGVAVPYYIYEFNNPVIAGSTSYTFLR